MGGFLFYIGSIAFLLGVAMATLFDLPFELLLLVMLVSLVLALLAAWYQRQDVAQKITFNLQFQSTKIIWTLSFCCFALALGMARIELITPSESMLTLESKVGQTMTLDGVIVREPDVRARSQHLYTKVDGDLILVTIDRYGQFAYGDRILITGELQKPESFTTDLGRTFNYPGYLKAQGVEYLVRYGEVELLGKDEGNSFLSILLTGKHRFMEVIESLIPEPQVGLGEGLLLGAKRALGEELTEVFRRTGIIHIVVLSGYNVALVVAFVLYMLAFVLPSRGRVIFGLLAIGSFALMVGLSATVLRASIMAGLLLLAGITGRIYLISRALIATAVAMVLFNPYILIYDPGFQLSFLATLGLILGAPWLQGKFSKIPIMFGVREFLTATIVTQIFVLPLLLYQIGEFSVVSVVVNILVLPMVPVAMLLTFLAGVAGLISSTIALPMAFLANLSLAYILEIARFFADLPFAAFVVPTFPFWLVVISYLGLAVVVYRLLNSNKSPTEKTADLDGWVVQEEEEVGKTGGSRSEPPAKEDKPIFFR